jgi:hypothetical protein
MTKRNGYDSVAALEKTGIAREDAIQLRRISMTLHRWHELECGDGDDYASWTITRGRKEKGEFIHDEDGAPYIERHVHTENKARYTPTPDKERGALKRLGKIMAKYPTLSAYVQGDPRGASLYILRPGDVPEGEQVDAYYSRGVVVYK